MRRLIQGLRMRLPGLLLGLSLLIVLPAHCSRADKYALLVGIDQYESMDITKLDDSVADVKSVGDSLTGNLGFPADHVKVMTSDLERDAAMYPTADHVLAELDLMGNNIGPDDTFVFYFSGHGFLRAEGDFLATVNANPFDLNTLKKSTLALDDLKQAMAGIKARQVVFILDACRSDPTKDKAGAPNKMTAEFARQIQIVAEQSGAGQAGTATLMACSQGERAWEWPEQGHGVFTYYLLQGMNGKAAEPDGSVTAYSLCNYVQDQVKTWSKQNRPLDQQQTPDFQLAGAARIVLGMAVPPPPPFQKRENPPPPLELVVSEMAEPMTRGEMALLLHRYLSYFVPLQPVDQLDVPSLTFDDVQDRKSPLFEALLHLKQMGVIQGKEGNTYKPSDPLTRYEGAMIVCRVLDLFSNNPKIKMGGEPLSWNSLTPAEREQWRTDMNTREQFADVPMGHWAYDAIDKIYHARFIEYCKDGCFVGGRPLTRYHAKLWINNIMSLFHRDAATTPQPNN